MVVPGYRTSSMYVGVGGQINHPKNVIKSIRGGGGKTRMTITQNYISPSDVISEEEAKE